MTTLDWVLFHAGTALFTTAAALGIAGARHNRSGLLAGARAATLAAAAALGILLLRHGLENRSFPISNRFDTQVFSCAVLAVLAVTIDLVRGLPVLTVGAAPFCALMAVVAATLGMPSGGTPPPASAWVGVHVVATLIAYGLFALAFLAAILYLVEQRQLKSGGSTALLGFMPSLETFYRLLFGWLALGVALLTVGVVVGYLFARRQDLPAGWRTDPKVILTTITWLAYLVVLGLAVAPGFKGRRTALAAAGCFVFVMGTLWATAFWSGFHRYS
jgi:ABC-type uncharacterized transport system permease subunit